MSLRVVGGSGKSMLMRYLFLDALKQAQKVPIFVELRDLNKSQSGLYDLIKNTLFDNEFHPDELFFKKAMRAGHFAIFLDGFDEVDDRAGGSRGIQKLVQTYEKNVYVVSSRPDDLFASWYAFNEWKIQPLTLAKACTLVDKVPTHVLDQKLRASFLEDLRTKLFKTHHSFLSNPLLLSIMILTYRDSADIPTRLSIFYDQAYTTLFQRHDALKGGYKRRRRTKLDIQEFARVFSAFSIVTFNKKKWSFTETEVLAFLKKARALVSLEFKEEAFLGDAIQAVSLLVRDGMTIAFAHRSFQDYFAALFILQAGDEHKRELIRKYSKNYFQDTVIQLLHDLDPELIQREVILPALENIEQVIKYGRKLGREQYKRYVEHAVGHFTVVPLRRGSTQSMNIYPHPGGEDATGHSCAWLLRFLKDNYSFNFEFYPNDELKAFEDEACKTLKTKKDGVELNVKKVTGNPALLDALAKGRHVLSMDALKKLVQLKTQLTRSQDSLDTSIEKELLN